VKRISKLVTLLGIVVFLFGLTGLAAAEKDKTNHASEKAIAEFNKHIGEDMSYYQVLSILFPDTAKNLPKEIKELYQKTPYQWPTANHDSPSGSQDSDGGNVSTQATCVVTGESNLSASSWPLVKYDSGSRAWGSPARYLEVESLLYEEVGSGIVLRGTKWKSQTGPAWSVSAKGQWVASRPARYVVQGVHSGLDCNGSPFMFGTQRSRYLGK